MSVAVLISISSQELIKLFFFCNGCSLFVVFNPQSYTIILCLQQPEGKKSTGSLKKMKQKELYLNHGNDSHSY